MKEDSKRGDIKKSFKEFSEETTLHGVRYLAKSEYAGYVRCIWLLVILGMVASYAVIVSQSIQAYLRRETVTSTETVWNERLNFPTVTICNINVLARTYAAQHFPSLIPVFDTSERTENKGQNTTDKPDTTKYNTTLYEIFYGSMLPIEKMFGYCRWINREIQCKDYIGIVETDYGLCYYFPLNHLRQKRPSDFKISQPGPEFGFTFNINTHQEEYLLTPQSSAAGIKVLVHDPKKKPTPLINGIFFSPGFQHDVAIMRKESVRLSVPYAKSKCITDETYSFESCLYDCQTKIRYGKCDCLPTKTSSSDQRACTLADLFNCTDYNMEQYFKGACMCLPACSTVHYKSQTSSGLYPSDFVFQKLQKIDGLNESLQNYQKNNMIVRIYFESMEFVSEIQKAAMSWDQLIGDIGGQLGLFLGASFVTIIEGFDLLCKCCYILCTRKRQ